MTTAVRPFISVTVLFVLGGILGAGPATQPAPTTKPTTKPTFSLTDKQVVAGYDVTFKASKTRDGIPRRNGSIRAQDGSRVGIAILGEEGHPLLVAVPQMTLVPGALEGNDDTLKVAETILNNVADVKVDHVAFKRFVRDLQDARRNGTDDEVTRDFGHVRAKLEAMAEPDGSSIDVTLTMTRKPG